MADLKARFLAAARFGLGLVSLTAGCGEGPASGPSPAADTYWPAEDKTTYRWDGRWHDLSGQGGGGPLTVTAVVAGTTSDGDGRPVKIWRMREFDGDYYFRIADGAVWTNWRENDPRADYHRWLPLPPRDGDGWDDGFFRVTIRGPTTLTVPIGEFEGVYYARYDYVTEVGMYEKWWYAAGVGCIRYEIFVPGVKHEMLWLTAFQRGP
jgi:hypothetical protein